MSNLWSHAPTAEKSLNNTFWKWLIVSKAALQYKLISFKRKYLSSEEVQIVSSGTLNAVHVIADCSTISQQMIWKELAD